MDITINRLKSLGFTNKNKFLYMDARIDESFGLIYREDGIISIEADYCTEIKLPHIKTIKQVEDLFFCLKGYPFNAT